MYISNSFKIITLFVFQHFSYIWLIFLEIYYTLYASWIRVGLILVLKIFFNPWNAFREAKCTIQIPYRNNFTVSNTRNVGNTVWYIPNAARIYSTSIYTRISQCILPYLLHVYFAIYTRTIFLKIKVHMRGSCQICHPLRKNACTRFT
jgi:hypothetical protein